MTLIATFKQKPDQSGARAVFLNHIGDPRPKTLSHKGNDFGRDYSSSKRRYFTPFRDTRAEWTAKHVNWSLRATSLSMADHYAGIGMIRFNVVSGHPVWSEGLEAAVTHPSTEGG